MIYMEIFKHDKTISFRGTLDEWIQPVWNDTAETVTIRGVVNDSASMIVLGIPEIKQIIKALPEGVM